MLSRGISTSVTVKVDCKLVFSPSSGRNLVSLAVGNEQVTCIFVRSTEHEGTTGSIQSKSLSD